ncbi:hypothetical protein IFM89_026028 [Coptis chinensis]|uniref:Uncharacterized protein n=1 Tax=Coptis chinensis TaxID=261450 RepID=A0A835H5I4_9MAGN|nr:hypothetical protein IFM89_026028 [Coptis chinensis]
MFLSRPKTRMISSRHDGDAFRRLHVVRIAENAINCAQGPKEKIREMFNKIELSVSSYDNAGVAMVPSPDSSQQPCFPECLNWLLENQVHDVTASCSASEYAKDLYLNLPFSPKFVETMLHKRDLEFERVSKINSKGSKAYLAYTSERLTKLCDWKEVMKWQRKNGSMFNSPSTTAATFIQNQDAKCLEYLCLLLKMFANAGN